MDIKWWGVLAIIFIAEKVIQKKLPQKLVYFRLLLNIAASGFSLVFIGVEAVGAYQVVISDVNTADKILFVLLEIALAAIFVWANYRFWREWFTKYRPDK